MPWRELYWHRNFFFDKVSHLKHPNARGSLLDGTGHTEQTTKPGHEVAGCDQLHVGLLVRLEDQLEAAADLLLADCGHGNNLFERPRHPLLSTSDVKTSSSDGIVGTALQAFPIVNHLKHDVGPVNNVSGQVYPVRHLCDRSERVDQSSVAGGNCPSVVVKRSSSRVKAGLASGRPDDGGEV